MKKEGRKIQDRYDTRLDTRALIHILLFAFEVSNVIASGNHTYVLHRQTFEEKTGLSSSETLNFFFLPTRVNYLYISHALIGFKSTLF